MDDQEYQASILKVASPPPIRLDIDGAEQPFFIRRMSGYDGHIWAKQMAPYDGKEDEDPIYSGRFLAAVLVNEAGKQMWLPSDDAAAEQLSKIPRLIQNAIALGHRRSLGIADAKEPGKP